MTTPNGNADMYRQKVCRKAHRLACRVANEMESYSKLIDQRQEDAVTRFDRDELVIGNLLGSGGFNNVFELTEVDLLSEEDLPVSNQQQDQRNRMQQRIKPNQYAVKFLKYELIDNMQEYCNGAADLVVETKILANMVSHPNIIRLYGMSDAGISGFEEDVEGNYFLILDRLSETLNGRIKKWSDQIIKTSLLERLKVAYDLSSALKHVHKQNIIFRDLKPDNIGFDIHGKLKLFDFGLAKELHPGQKVSDETYAMSGATGSLRYMSPEVALSKPYGLSADIFSFAILFWEVCALEEPFQGMTTGQHLNHVIKGSHRPKLKINEWPDKVCKILKWSWMPDPSSRPTFKDIKKALGREIQSQQAQAHSAVSMKAIAAAKCTREQKPSFHPYPNLSQHDLFKKTSSNTENHIKQSPVFKNNSLPQQKSLYDLLNSQGDGNTSTFKNPFRSIMKNPNSNSNNTLLEALGEASKRIDSSVQRVDYQHSTTC